MKQKAHKAGQRLFRLRYIWVTALAVAITILVRTNPGPDGRDSYWLPLLYVPVIVAVFICRYEFTCALAFLLSAAGLWLSQNVIPASAPRIEHTAHFMVAAERAIIINAVALLGSWYMGQTRRQQALLERRLKMAGELLESSLWMDTSSSIEEASDIALITLEQRCPYKYAALYLRDEAGERLNLQSVQQRGGSEAQFPPSLLAGDTVLRGRLLNDYQVSDDFRDFMLPGARSVASVILPRTYQQTAGGLILVAFPKGQTSKASDLELLEDFAAQISLPLHRVRKQERLQGMAYTDAMTGLKNYRAFLSDIEEELRRAARYPRPIALIMLDVDRFKSVNDEFGHPAGDQALRHVASLIAATVRETDISARYGGEEFAILCPETTELEAEIVAERIRQAIESSRVVLSHDQLLPITASLGIASFGGAIDTEQALIDAADAALYEAKHTGRNRVVRAGSRLSA